MGKLKIVKPNLRRLIYDISLNDFKDKNKKPYMNNFFIARNINNSWMGESCVCARELSRGRELSRRRTIRTSKFNK